METKEFSIKKIQQKKIKWRNFFLGSVDNILESSRFLVFKFSDSKFSVFHKILTLCLRLNFKHIGIFVRYSVLLLRKTNYVRICNGIYACPWKWSRYLHREYLSKPVYSSPVHCLVNLSKNQLFVKKIVKNFAIFFQNNNHYFFIQNEFQHFQIKLSSKKQTKFPFFSSNKTLGSNGRLWSNLGTNGDEWDSQDEYEHTCYPCKQDNDHISSNLLNLWPFFWGNGAPFPWYLSSLLCNSPLSTFPSILFWKGFFF